VIAVGILLYILKDLEEILEGTDSEFNTLKTFYKSFKTYLCKIPSVIGFGIVRN
jgi:hypothetical protein